MESNYKTLVQGKSVPEGGSQKGHLHTGVFPLVFISLASSPFAISPLDLIGAWEARRGRRGLRTSRFCTALGFSGNPGTGGSSSVMGLEDPGSEEEGLGAAWQFMGLPTRWALGWGETVFPLKPPQLLLK